MLLHDNPPLKPFRTPFPRCSSRSPRSPFVAFRVFLVHPTVCLHASPPLLHFSRALVGHSYLQDATGAGLSSLVDLAVTQGAVGTVLSTDSEDGAVFGFVTALPLRYLSKEHQCVQVAW